MKGLSPAQIMYYCVVPVTLAALLALYKGYGVHIRIPGLFNIFTEVSVLLSLSSIVIILFIFVCSTPKPNRTKKGQYTTTFTIFF